MSIIQGHLIPAAAGGGPTLSYLLEATWDATSPTSQSYTNGQSLNTAAEGVDTGVLTSNENASFAFSTASNEFVVTDISGSTVGQLVSADLAKGVGQAAKVVMSSSNMAGAYPFEFQLTSDNTIRSRSHAAYLVVGSGEWYVRTADSGGTFISTMLVLKTSADNTDYPLIFVLGGFNSSGEPYISGSTSGFNYGFTVFLDVGASWEILAVDCLATTLQQAAMYYSMSNNSNAGGRTSTLDDFNVTDPSGITFEADLVPDVGDLFTTTFGTADTGESWTQQSGTWTVSGGKATCNGAGIATVPITSADFFALVTANTGTGNPSFAFRYTDSSNYWYVQLDNASNQFEIHEVNGGSDTLRANVAKTLADSTDYTIQIRADGAKIDAWVDGGSKITYGSATLNQTTATAGLKTDATSPTFDNFALYELAATHSALDTI